MVAKKSTASSTSIFSTSPMLLPRQLTAKRLGVEARSPWHTSQGSFTSGRKLMAMVRTPAAFAGRAAGPSPVLKLKRAGA